MIQIKEPCNADWQEMTPEKSGKFCGACEKVVIDFSKMNDAEIKNYFITYSNQKTCGRFLASQLNRPLLTERVPLFNALFRQWNNMPVLRTIMLLITSTSIWISGCVKNNTTKGAPVYESENAPFMGDTVVVEPDSALVKPHTGLIDTIGISPENMIVGKIKMENTHSQKIKRRK
jgi:hypothetical protein